MLGLPNVQMEGWRQHSIVAVCVVVDVTVTLVLADIDAMSVVVVTNRCRGGAECLRREFGSVKGQRLGAEGAGEDAGGRCKSPGIRTSRLRWARRRCSRPGTTKSRSVQRSQRRRNLRPG